jgi:tetratricopeptide (TPR) repeat protein
MTDEHTEVRPWLDPDAEAVVEPQPETSPWWRRWWRRWKWRILALLGSPERREARLRELDDAITLSPASAANYTLRGELHMQMGQPEPARHDFQRALAEAQVESTNWGIVEQALVDRAQRGLAQAERRMARAAPPPSQAEQPLQPDTSMVDASGERLTDDIPSGTGA